MALKAVMVIGISRVIIDTVNLVTAIQTRFFDRAPGGVIFKEIRDLLELYFVPLLCCSLLMFIVLVIVAHMIELAYYGFERDPDQPNHLA